MIAETYITQDELIQGLQAAGYNANRYTLEYWRSQGLIPQLRRLGKGYYYSQDDVALVYHQCDVSRRQQTRDILLELELEGDKFQIIRIESYRDGSRMVTLLHTVDGGVLVQKQSYKESLVWLQKFSPNKQG